MSNSFPSFGSDLGISNLTGIKYKDYDLGKQIDFGGSGKNYDEYKGRGGFLRAVAESTQKDKDKDDTFNRAKALNLAQDFKRGSTKISDDATLVEGYTDPGFSYTEPGRRGFGDIIGAGAGFLVGNMLMPGVGGKYGAALGQNIGGRF